MDNIQIQKKNIARISRGNLKKDISLIRSFLNLDENTSISITIRDDEFLQIYNFQFRGIDAPTDVLSFDSGEIDPDTGFEHLGDILISYDRVVAQAEKSNHSEYNELMLLIAHGILHLLGYDHATSKERDMMWKKQGEVLAAIGVIGIDVSNYDE
jgi:probable rRNA maturation factor